MIVNTGDWIWFAKIQSKSECLSQTRGQNTKNKNFSLVDHIVLNSFHFNPEYPDQTINKIPIRKGQWRGQKIKSFEITIKYWETFQLKSNISNSSPF